MIKNAMRYFALALLIIVILIFYQQKYTLASSLQY